MKEARRRPAIRDPEALTREELRRLAKAERKLASADRSQSAAGVREIQDLERRHAERIEGQSLAARLAETSSLALSRGEEVRAETVRIAVAQFDEHGARLVRDGLPLYRQETHSRVRIASRGGLQLALERGDLDGGAMKAERLSETGKAYDWRDGAAEVQAARTAVKTVQRQAAASQAVAIADQRAQDRVRTITRTLIQKVPIYVSATTDARFPLPWGFVRLHDAAATGDDLSAAAASPGRPDDAASDVAASEAASAIVANYGACRADQARLDELQAWTRSMGLAK